MTQKPVMLCILDGWGYRAQKENNAIEMGNTPVWHDLVKNWPHTMLETSGLHVGLPDGQMGNSEVGHTNLGAGRVVMQDLPRIDMAIQNKTLGQNPVFVQLVENLKKTGGTCHLMGLLGPGGVHAQQRHIVALADLLNRAGIRTVLHGFLDGRDTPPASAKGFIQELIDEIRDMPLVSVGTLGGRYYGMDRDNRWDRVNLAYEAIVNGQGVHAETPSQAIEESYKQEVFDEFVLPCVIGSYAGMCDGDAVVMANYRSDRAREITKMMLQPDFDLAPRSRVVAFCDAVAMTEYSSEHTAWMHTLFPPEDLKHIFGEEIANAGLTQLRIAETEKYAHVTFFFNGGRESVFNGEERILIPSPKVATYDLQPEMSAVAVTDELVKAIESQKFDVIVVNYANGDMVGHTGSIPAAIKAVETVDACVGRLIQALKKVDGCALFTADHGNCEDMLDENGKPKTAHTNTPVQAVLFNAKGVNALNNGKLADVAPTLLQLLNLPQPVEMTGKSLIKE